MNKRHLSEQQKRRIDAAQMRQVAASGLTGTIIQRFHHEALVAISAENSVQADIRQNLGVLVAGDHVSLAQTPAGFCVTAVLPRQNLLARDTRFSQTKPLAANLTQLVIVTAVEPETPLLHIDRYFLAANSLGIKAVLIVNKLDLAKDVTELQKRYHLYETIGHPVLYCHRDEPNLTTRLNKLLSNEVSVFVGQSGVGKSSLIQRLLPDETIETGDISEKQKLGKHTTSNARVYFLASGAIIDSPGVREFQVSDYNAANVWATFPEIKAYQGKCRFSDCQHELEPGCALQAALAEGKILEDRLEDFKSLLKGCL